MTCAHKTIIIIIIIVIIIIDIFNAQMWKFQMFMWIELDTISS